MTHISAETLSQCGILLYGPQWQAELSRALGCHRNAMNRYALGQRKVPKGWPQKLDTLLKERSEAIIALRLTIPTIL